MFVEIVKQKISLLANVNCTKSAPKLFKSSLNILFTEVKREAQKIAF